MKMRPPATPIVNIDPYFSVWTEESVLRNTVHWTGKPNTMTGRVFIDGKEYHFLGQNKWLGDGRECDAMDVIDTEIDAYSTVLTYSNEHVKLTVHFTSPLSLPICISAPVPSPMPRYPMKALTARSMTLR